MRKLLFIGLLVFAIYQVNAQKLSLSEPEEISLRQDDFSVIGKYQGLTAVYRNHAAMGEIIFYNKQMVKERVSTLSFLPSSIDRILFSTNGQSLLVCYTATENRQAQVFVSKLMMDNTWSKPLEITPKIDIESERFKREVSACFSEDESKLLVYSFIQTYEERLLKASVYDTDLKEVAHFEDKIPADYKYLLEGGRISNEGNIYLLAAERPYNKRGGIEKLMLLHTLPGSVKFIQTPIILEKNALNDLHLAMNNELKMIHIIGYFSDGRNSPSRGFFFCSYDEKIRILSENQFTPLALQIGSSRDDLQDLKIKNISFTKEGELEIITEKTYDIIRTLSSLNPIVSSSFMMTNIPDNTRTVHEYSNDEIVIFNMKRDGSLAWSQTILKEQTTQDDFGLFASYAYFQHRLGKAYIFNDIMSRQSRLLSAYVSSKGQLTVKELQTSEEMSKWNIVARSGYQISGTEIVLPCLMKNYLCFLKISY